MKKILTYIIGIIFLSALFVGCEEEEDIFRRGVGIYLSNKSFYPLDQGLSGDIQLSDPAISSVEIYVDDALFTTLTLSGGEGTYMLSKADLGIGEIGDELLTKFSTNVESNPAAEWITISVIDPLTKEGPSDVPPVDTTVFIKYMLTSECTAPTSLVITRQVNSGTPETVAGTYDMFNDSIPVTITPEQASDTLTYQFTFENEYGMVESTHEILVIVKRFWDFENYAAWSVDFAPWTLVDNDGLGVYTSSAFSYPGEGEAGSWRIFNYTEAGAPEGWEAFSGENYAFCMAAVPDGAQGNDDWMISDNFDIEDGYELSLTAKSITDAYGLERMIVTVVDNGTMEETVLTTDPYTEVPTDWTTYTWDLSPWAGKNIAVKIGCVSYDAYALMLDDFEIVTNEGLSLSQGFEKSQGYVPHLTK